jgi:hypothetical protein
MRVKARMNGRQTEIIHVVEVGQRARIPFVHTTTKKRKKDSQKKKKKRMRQRGTQHRTRWFFTLCAGEWPRRREIIWRLAL